MPSNMDYDNNMLSFLHFIDNDIKGQINIEYFKYINTINNLANNGSNEISQYNNFINNSTKNYPDMNKVNDLFNKAKQDNPIDFHRMFCVYMWYYIYH